MKWFGARRFHFVTLGGTTNKKTSIITSLRQEVTHGGCPPERRRASKQRRIRRFITIPRFLKPSPASACVYIKVIPSECQATEPIGSGLF